MEKSEMKNMIILKNLPSNMVKEAYVVFKDNIKVHKVQEDKNNKCNSEETKPKEYMIKEAEMVIQDYITKIEDREYELGNGNKKLKEKYKRLKALTIFLSMFSILSSFLILVK